MSRVRTFAEAIGKGVVAGAVGTAAMTVSSTLEARLRRRAFSTAPAAAAAKALGIETFDDCLAYSRFSNLVHWGYGTGWGVARAALRTLGASPSLATPAHFAALWASEVYTLPKYEVAPPVTEWELHDVAIDLFHHLVYVAVTAGAYEALERAGVADSVRMPAPRGREIQFSRKRSVPEHPDPGRTGRVPLLRDRARAPG